MGRFSKPKEFVDAVQFWPDRKPWPDNVIKVGEEYVLHRLGVRFSNWYGVNPGDWIVTSASGFNYPYHPKTFWSEYDKEKE